MAIVCALHLSSRICLTDPASNSPATSFTLIVDRIDLSLPNTFAPRRGADLRVAKSELCTPGWLTMT